IPGAATILDAESACDTLLADTDSALTPVTASELISLDHRHLNLLATAAYTVSKYPLAWRSGTDAVGLGSATSQYLLAMTEPRSEIRLVFVVGINGRKNVGGRPTASVCSVDALGIASPDLMRAYRLNKVSHRGQIW